ALVARVDDHATFPLRCGSDRPLPDCSPTGLAERADSPKRHPPWTERIMAPLCQAMLAWGVKFGAGPGCGLSEAPTVGVGSVTLAVRVVPACPPGPVSSCASATSWR